MMLSHFHGELRFSGVMGRRNGPSGLREDDDDYTLIGRFLKRCKVVTSEALVDFTVRNVRRFRLVAFPLRRI